MDLGREVENSCGARWTRGTRIDSFQELHFLQRCSWECRESQDKRASCMVRVNLSLCDSFLL